jgi:Ribbon-helix-helix protein, copG family
MVKPKAAKSKKRRPGRPATGRDPMVGLRAGTELTAAIDAWAEANGIESRSDAIRRLLDLALKADDFIKSGGTLEQWKTMWDKVAADVAAADRLALRLRGGK